MSIMSLGRGNSNGSANGSANGKSGKHVEPPPAPYPSRPVVKAPDQKEEQFQLGNVTLDAVDRLTGMTADEIERVAEQILDGADETAAVLRELARRVRENGVFANDRLARFVRVANQCADIARSMQQSIQRREEPEPPQPTKVETSAEDEVEVADIDDAPGVAAEQETAPDRAAP